MKERWPSLLFAAGALLLFYAFMFPKAGLEEPSRPLSTDTRADGEQALWRWLQAEHIPVSSLRYRYDHLLPSPGGAVDTGNVLITVMPHQLAIRKEEWQPISRWVEAGNTLLVLAALDDSPYWSAGIHPEFLGELQRLTHIAFVVATDDRKGDGREGLQNLFGEQQIQLVPRGDHPLLSGVRRAEGTSDLPAARWQARALSSALPLALLQRSDSGAPMLWLSGRGNGQLIVSGLASPFANSRIDRADNAKLLSNILAWSRSPGGSVIFDDSHQGLTAYYDAQAFYADPRLHRTLGWSVLLWLAFVLGPLPLRYAYSLWKPVDEAALIEASARFYSVAVPRHEIALRLFENFFNALRRKLNLPQNGAPLWEWLQTQSRISTAERTHLQSLYSTACASEAVDLRKLQNLLSDLQGRVA